MNKGSAGIGFCGLLTIAFVVLRLCHIIEWSWVWILSPLWIGFIVSIIIVAIMIFIALSH